MRRLDELLSHAAERGDRMGPDRLIEHLERRLAGEREVIVAAPPRRGAMVTTSERPVSTTETPKRPRTRWAIALAGFAVAIVAVVGAVILFGGSDEDVAAPETPAEVMTLLARAVEQADPSLTDLTPVGVPYFPAFLEWNLALGLDPEFDCATVGSGAVLFICDMTYGRNYFFSVVLEEEVSSTVMASVDGKSVHSDDWLAPPGIADVEKDMQTWIRATYPELDAQMFSPDGSFKFDATAGELHMQYLDEYVAYREANS